MAQNEGINFVELAESIEETREAIRALVSGLTADGFTDEQARDIVAGFFRLTGRDKEED